jgi:3-deoxy-D-manno-octulosonic-acid transferase
MLWLAYNVLFAVGYALMLPRFVWRMARRGGYGKGFLQRFGFYGRDVEARLARGGRIWIHAVSVGEIQVALAFTEELRRRRPDLAFVLTTTTSTAHAVAARRLHADDVLLYVPADFPVLVRRALRKLRPAALLLTESELWPNLIRLAAGQGVPVALINGRISPPSARGYRALRVFFGRAVRCVRLFLVQTDSERDCLLDLGASPDRVRVLGSAKFDLSDVRPDGGEACRALLARLWPDPSRLLLAGGSTWPGEERALLSAYAGLRREFPGLRLVLVPRHAERRAEVEGAIRRAGFSFARKTDLDAGRTCAERPDVLLVDTTGDLARVYECADAVFVGKTLTRHGGQNPIEPALLGRAIVVGPNLENFQAAAEAFRKAGALVEVRDVAGLEAALRALLADPARRRDLGARARAVADAGKGVIARSVDLLLPLLDRPV